MKSFLHVGCGPATKANCPAIFQSETWREVRLDIDPQVQPDVVGSITDMTAVSDGHMDAIYSSHNLEHLYPHEVELALKEFLRVLSPTGFALITCPDLQSICQLVANDRLLDTAYVSPAGPITPLDMLYGYRGAIQGGNVFMAHKCGFTLKVLLGCLEAAGFKSVAGFARPTEFALWAVGRKDAVPDSDMLAFTQSLFR